MKRSLLGVLLLASPTAAEPVAIATPVKRPVVAPAHKVSTGGGTEELAPRRVNDPAMAGRVFGARVSSPREPGRSVVERSSAFGGFKLTPPSEHKSWRPKYMLWPMKSSLSSGSGTRGISLKVRF